MSGAAAAGAVVLLASSSVSAGDADLVDSGQHKQPECLVFGTLTVANFDVDVQITVAFSELAAGVDANVNLVCSSPLESSPTAVVFLNTENDLIVPLELYHPGIDTLFGDFFASRGHTAELSPSKVGDQANFVYRGTAGFNIQTGTDPFELEDRVNALLAQGTVVVKADGTTGVLDVQGALVQGTIGAP